MWIKGSTANELALVQLAQISMTDDLMSDDENPAGHDGGNNDGNDNGNDDEIDDKNDDGNDGRGGDICGLHSWIGGYDKPEIMQQTKASSGLTAQS